MLHEDTVVQGVYGEALDTVLQEARDNAENAALLSVLRRMCHRAQLDVAKRGGEFGYASLYVSDILTVMGSEDSYDAIRIAKEKAEGREAET